MKKTILVIEDDAILQENIKAVLEKNNFKVVQSLDGLRVDKIVKKEKPDLILLDLILPGKDGFKILSDLKSNNKSIGVPVMILTVIGTKSSIDECKMLGADDYLVKSDYSLNSIVKKIKKHLK